MTLLFSTALLAYLIACGLYLASLGRGGDRLGRYGRVALFAAFALHTIDIGARCVQGVHPVATAQEAVSFVTWVTIGVYLLVSRQGKLGIAGAFVTPVAIVLLLGARVTPVSASSPVLGILGRVHISLAVIGDALFTFAAALATLYLLEDGQLRHKRLGVLLSKGPPLARLDEYGHRCVTLGFPIFTMALITGAMWVARLPGHHLTPRPEYVLALFTWIAFAALLVARSTAGWRGRRAAVMTLFGFAASLLVLVIYVARGALGG